MTATTLSLVSLTGAAAVLLAPPPAKAENYGYCGHSIQYGPVGSKDVWYGTVIGTRHTHLYHHYHNPGGGAKWSHVWDSRRIC